MTNLSAYAPLSERVAALGEEDDLALTPGLFPGELAEAEALGNLVIRGPGRRFLSDSSLPDLPFEVTDMSLGHDWYAEAETYRRIGLWLFHLLFSGRDFAGLTLGHPDSRFAELWVLLTRPDLPRSGLLHASGPLRYERYDYVPTPVVRHPFCAPPMGEPERLDPEDRPMFRLGWSVPGERYTGRTESADQVILSVTPEGLCALAGLFLDFAAPRNDVVEINMEPPFVGFAATQPLSLEARFWLPGSFGFYADTLDQMSFEGMA